MNLLAQERYNQRNVTRGSLAREVLPCLDPDRTGQSRPTPGGTCAASWFYNRPLRPERRVTSSTYMDSSWSLRSTTLPVLAKAEHLMGTLPSGDLRRNAETFLSALREVLIGYHQAGADLTGLPMLGAFVLDDDSLQFEWAYRDCRLGFGIESDANQSSWYLITTAEAGEVKATGLIQCPDSRQWLLWLVFFIYLRS
jgi:hypothetical protein